MYFIRENPENIWLIGLQNHNLYGIGDKDGQLVIYWKDVFDAGKWDEFVNLDISINSQEECETCESKMPAAGGIIASKLWIMATGTSSDKSSAEVKPHIFCIDLETKAVVNFSVKEDEINEYIKEICMECDTLQITFEDHVNEKPRFMVLPNRVRSAGPIISITWPPYPAFKQFYFMINNENQTCEFGYFEELLNNSKGLFVAGLPGENYFDFGMQRLGYMGLRQLCIGGDYRRYIITNFTSNEGMVGSRFFRNEQNDLQCVVKEANDGNSFKLSIFKPNIDMENETVRLDFVSSFIVDNHFPDIKKCLIFTTPNMIVLSSSTEFVTVMNRILTLSEISYLALQNISISQKTTLFEKFEKLVIAFKKENLDPTTSGNSGISMKFLRENCGIPKNVSINHGSG